LKSQLYSTLALIAALIIVYALFRRDRP
jgi:hypothetical protein